MYVKLIMRRNASKPTCWQVRKRAAQTNTPATPCASLFCKKRESSTTGDIVLHVAEVVGEVALLLVVVGLGATVLELDMVCNIRKKFLNSHSLIQGFPKSALWH